MTVEKYVPELHYKMVAEWWEKQGRQVPFSWLPATGFVVQDLAAGFLYTTDSQIGFFEMLTKNPEAGQQEVNRALDAIVGAIMEEAKSKEMKAVVGLTGELSVAQRARKHGFETQAGRFLLRRI